MIIKMLLWTTSVQSKQTQKQAETLGPSCTKLTLQWNIDTTQQLALIWILDIFGRQVENQMPMIQFPAKDTLP